LLERALNILSRLSALYDRTNQLNAELFVLPSVDQVQAPAAVKIRGRLVRRLQTVVLSNLLLLIHVEPASALPPHELGDDTEQEFLVLVKDDLCALWY
jgi:hypothetical protein